MLFAACGKDTDSKLFGKWKLQEVEANGVVQQIDTVFFNFQHSLFMYQVYVPVSDSYTYCYGYCTETAENTLLIELTDSKNFLPYTDWTTDKRTYTIDKLAGKELIMSSEGKRYTFRRF